MDILISWDEFNYGEDGYNIYRSTSTIDPNNLPAVHDTAPSNSRSYRDNISVLDLQEYYYRIATRALGSLFISDEIVIIADSATAYKSGFMMVCAAVSGQFTYSYLDVSDTSDPNWEANYGRTGNFGLFSYSYHLNNSTDSGILAGILPNLFSSKMVFDLKATAVNYSTDIAEFDMLFQDDNNNTIAALRAVSDSSYSTHLYYGSNLNNLTAAGTVGAFPFIAGSLTFTQTTMIFTNSLEQTYNESFTFPCDMSSVTSISFPYFRSKTRSTTRESISYSYLKLREPNIVSQFNLVRDEPNNEVTFTWDNEFDYLTKVNVYRSTSEIDPGNLPTVHEVVVPGVLEFNEITPTSANYLYTFGFVYGSGEKLFNNFSSKLTIPIRGLISHYTMDSINGTTIDDEEALHDASILGATVLPTGGVEGSQAVGFDGINDYVSIPSSQLTGSLSELTISLWVKTTGYGAFYTKINTIQSYVLLRLNSSKDDFRLSDGGNEYTGLSFSEQDIEVIQDGNWHHIAATYGPLNGMVLYLDGSNVNSAAGFGTLQIDSNPVNLGRDARSQDYLEGILDEVRVYGEELTSGEINQLAIQF